jgi:hypothetical protein
MARQSSVPKSSTRAPALPFGAVEQLEPARQVASGDLIGMPPFDFDRDRLTRVRGDTAEGDVGPARPAACRRVLVPDSAAGEVAVEFEVTADQSALASGMPAADSGRFSSVRRGTSR